MNKEIKLSIFVGSTKEDLGKARDAVEKAILLAGHIPSGMELWPASYTPTLDAIGQHLEKCDIHLIILGSRYGSISTEDNLSFTEWEYRRSIADGRRVIAFLLEKNALNAALESLDEEARAKLVKFREDLEKRALCRYFDPENIQSIATDCINSINEAINTGSLSENAGWIRANSAHGQRLKEIENNIFLQRILDTLYGFSTLTRRVEKEQDAKRALGNFFVDEIIPRVKRHGYHNLFFESGSTLAYVSDAFEEWLLKRNSGTNNQWKITTNNALTLLQFLLHTHVNVSPRPAGAPEDHYGAMFDDVLLENPEAPPRLPRSLFSHEALAIEKTVETLQGDSVRRLYLATASGLDLDNPEPNFQGPHVGSHPNMLFKRAIFQTGQPVILFLSGMKLYKPFVEGCYPVFDCQYTWAQACEESILAMIIGYETDDKALDDAAHLDTKEMILQKLNQMFSNFDLAYASKEYKSSGVVMIANNRFTELFPKE